jgi:putative addiction module killer protein
VFEIRHYLTAAGKDIFESWLESLGDEVTEARIDARIGRLTRGNFGDCKPVGDGVWELRINLGPGYRVYYAIVARRCVLLLAGGDKRKQSADIARAIAYLKDYKLRSNKA